MATVRECSEEARRLRILQVARAAFLEHGYAATSMSAIACTLGGSKTTLWKYFPGKQALFMAVAEDLIAEYLDGIASALECEGRFEAVLHSFGESLLRALTAPPVAALTRIVAAEGAAVPGLGAMFHERGLERGWQMLRDYFSEAQRRGLVAADADPLHAAKHFLGLCESGCYRLFFMGGACTPGDNEIAEDVNAAVSAFLKAYGTQQATALAER